MEGPSAAPSPLSASSALSEEGQQGETGKPTAALSPDEASGPESWQTDSLVSSWATVGTLDPEEAKNLEASDALLLAEERSENHSTISDIVHLEREEVELLEEAEEQAEDVVAGGVEDLQSSMMSVLGTEKELAELRVEQVAQVMYGEAPELKAPKTMEMLMSVEDSELHEEPEEVVWPLLCSTPPPAIPEPPVSASVPGHIMSSPVHEDPEFQPLREEPPSPPWQEQQLLRKEHKESQEKVKKEEKEEEARKEVPIPFVPPAPPVDTQEKPKTEPVVAPLAKEESFDISTQEVPVTQEPEPPVPPSSAFELTTLLYGSAAVVAVMGMVAYGALALSRK